MIRATGKTLTIRNTGARSPKVVLANGCFDIFHLGHLRHLEAAYDHGDVLVVSVTRDRSVDKGPGRPFYDEETRLSLVQGVWCVDRVILVDSSIEALRKVKPHVFAKGSDYLGKIRPEDERWCRRHGCQIVFTEEPTDSSTEIYVRLKKSIGLQGTAGRRRDR